MRVASDVPVTSDDALIAFRPTMTTPVIGRAARGRFAPPSTEAGLGEGERPKREQAPLPREYDGDASESDGGDVVSSSSGGGGDSGVSGDEEEARKALGVGFQFGAVPLAAPQAAGKQWEATEERRYATAVSENPPSARRAMDEGALEELEEEISKGGAEEEPTLRLVTDEGTEMAARRFVGRDESGGEELHRVSDSSRKESSDGVPPPRPLSSLPPSKAGETDSHTPSEAAVGGDDGNPSALENLRRQRAVLLVRIHDLSRRIQMSLSLDSSQTLTDQRPVEAPSVGNEADLAVFGSDEAEGEGGATNEEDSQVRGSTDLGAIESQILSREALVTELKRARASLSEVERLIASINITDSDESDL